MRLSFYKVSFAEVSTALFEQESNEKQMKNMELVFAPFGVVATPLQGVITCKPV